LQEQEAQIHYISLEPPSQFIKNNLLYNNTMLVFA